MIDDCKKIIECNKNHEKPKRFYNLKNRVKPLIGAAITL
jgi:hypothetical protein